MSVTAARLGSAPLTLDWSHLASVAAGTSTRSYGPNVQEWTEAWTKLKARFTSGEIGFYDTPVQDDLSQSAYAKRPYSIYKRLVDGGAQPNSTPGQIAALIDERAAKAGAKVASAITKRIMKGKDAFV